MFKRLFIISTVTNLSTKIKVVALVKKMLTLLQNSFSQYTFLSRDNYFCQLRELGSANGREIREKAMGFARLESLPGGG